MAFVDINQAIARLKELSRNLPRIVELNLETAAIESYALVERRLIQTGKTADGNLFPDYDPKYKKKKEKAGKYSGHRDFKFSGNMLNSIGLAERKKENGKFTVVMTGRDNETLLKMEGNANITPGFLNASKEEIELVSESFKEGTTKDIQQYFA